MFGDYHNPNDYWEYDPYKGMDDDERIQAGCLQGVIYIIALAIGMVLCSLFTSCKSVEYVPVVEHKTDTVRVNHTERDSIWLHDSIRVTEKGDTVRIEKWHTKYIEKQVRDTTYISKTDTVPHPYLVFKEVPAKMSQWQKWMMWIGLVTVLGIVIFVVIKLKRFLPGI
jgi:hypothetical protein